MDKTHDVASLACTSYPDNQAALQLIDVPMHPTACLDVDAQGQLAVAQLYLALPAQQI